MTPERRWAGVRLAALAVVSYIPLLFTAPGKVAADTKAYLYLDPGRLLARAAYLWDENVALGTVTHQNIGYLWPMGPWFWLFEALGSPDWVAQRLWMGTLLFVAGAGILYLGRTIGPPSPLAWTAGAFAYLLSPYVLDYVARISVLLLPWAALPWLLALTHLSLRRGRWREPALFALVVATAGGINATALALAGLGPLLWIAFEVFVHRDVDLRRAGATVLRIGVLTIVTNLWWIAGLAVQSGWGLDVLRYTETVETVARSSLSSEVLRGLGYWFFYGTDKLGPWIEPGRTFTEQPWLIVVGFVLPVLALLAAFVTRWRYRSFAVALVVLGTAVAVGAYPYADPSPIGSLFKRFATSSTAGLALRSTGRAVPLVVLGLVLLLVGGIVAVGRARPRAGAALAGAVIAFAALGNPALWTGAFVAENLRHPEEVPGYWKDAVRHLDAESHDTRVLEIPGSDFATYRWGNQIEPITPGLTDRPFVARELVPFGTEATADLLIALDRRIQEGVLDPASLVPVARLMGVGDVVVRGDLAFERYRTARPAQLWQVLDPVPLGFAEPVAFGEPRENRAVPELPMRDEIHLATRGTAVRAPVVALPVSDPMPIVRTRSASDAVLLEGDGEGVVEAAAAGLLGGDRALLSTPALAGRRDLLRDAIRDGGTLVVTDTNRQRARRWGTVRDNDGYTERAGEEPLEVDASDNRLPLFPDAPVSAYTTVEQRGVVRVEASAYGNPVTYTPADRPANAFDGDLGTGWVVGGLGPVGGRRLLVETIEPVTTDHIAVVQADTGPRRITRLGVVLDGKKVTSVDIDDRSRATEGQRLDLGGERTFRTLELVIEGDSVGRLANYSTQNGVGLSEVIVPGVRVEEVVRLPSHLLGEAGVTSNANPLTILLSRLRANPSEPFAHDEEITMARALTLPAGRTFTLRGQARIDDRRPDEAIDSLLGVTGATVRSSARLAGAPAMRASAAVDGNESTAWTHRFGDQRGAWLEIVREQPVTLDGLELALVADGDHSVPTRVSVSNESGERRTVDLPAVEDGDEPGHTVSVPARFPAITGQTIRLTVDEVREQVTRDWFSKGPTTMPVAVAELGVPELELSAAGGRLPSACRDDLLSIDGEPVSVEVTGTAATAVALRGLEVRACGPDAGGIRLGAGDHEVRATAGGFSGLDLDRLVLASAAGGGAAPADGPGTTEPVADRGSDVRTLSSGRTSFDLEVSGDEPVWLVLGQSLSPGWHASADGDDLGEPVLVDGFANGWLVDPGPDGRVEVALRWEPQRIVWAGIGLSVVGVVACLAILLAGALRRRRPEPVPATAAPAFRERPFEVGAPLAWPRAGVLALAAGVAIGLVVHPLLGLAGAVVTIGALRLPKARAIGVAGPALLAAAGLYTAAKTAVRDLKADFGWTDFFRPAHMLAWAALALLAVLLLVDRERDRDLDE